MASESTIARLKFDMVVNNAGLRAGMAQAASIAKGGAGQIGAAIGRIGGFGKIGGALSGFAGQAGLNFGPLGGVMGAIMNPGTLGLGAAGGLFALSQKMAADAKEIQRGSQRTGFGIVGYQELGYAAKKSGVEIGTAEMAVNRMRRQIGNLQAGKGASVFKDMGLGIKDFKDQSPEKSFELIAKHIMDIKDPMQRARIEMEMFGRSGAAVEPLLKNIAQRGLKGYNNFALTGGEVYGMAGMKTTIQDTIPAMMTKAYAKYSMGMADAVFGVANFFGAGLPTNASGNMESLAKLDSMSAQKALENQGPSALAGIAMRGSQEAYASTAAWTAGVEDQSQQQIDLLAQIANNTSTERN